MSMTGSLISYENHADSQRGSLKPKVTITPANVSSPPPVRRSSRTCLKAHLNSLWSVWYGVCLTAFQAYLAAQCGRRFLGYAVLPWPVNPPPRLELNAYLAFLGISVIALPFFLIAAVFKVGNLANDGFKLGRSLSTCTADPPSVLLGEDLFGRSSNKLASNKIFHLTTFSCLCSGSSENQGVFRSLWQHGGPTAPFLHLTIALCLLIPKLMMEGRLIHSGFLSRGKWSFARTSKSSNLLSKKIHGSVSSHYWKILHRFFIFGQMLQEFS